MSVSNEVGRNWWTMIVCMCVCVWGGGGVGSGEKEVCVNVCASARV